ncbi:hypothetical protein F5B17DRAFT_451571 [Nemania serpens]|nr:hypothetical protein F5B17DRAFT_451571 [Nemania serpens]
MESLAESLSMQSFPTGLGSGSDPSPIKVKLGIRDAWDSADAPAQKAIRSLKAVTGVRVTANPEWPLLYAELAAFYPDAATLVPSVAAAVGACCAALGALADDEANADWADTLLERTSSHIRIFVEVSKSRDTTILWSAQQSGIIISLPKAPVPSQSHLLSFFSGSLLTLFDDDEKQAVGTIAGAATEANTTPSSPTQTPAQDDWADISLDAKTGTAGIVEPSHPTPSPSQSHSHSRPAIQSAPTIDILPTVDTVPRPDDLLQRPPYHLLVHAHGLGHGTGGRTCVEVQCSHSPTLQFLAEYLRKWARTNHNNTTKSTNNNPASPSPKKPPFADVTLHQSAFGLGIMYDRLTVSSEGRYSTQAVSPTIVLALVEGVLGYRGVSQQLQDGSSWAFRRDVEFRGGRY